MSRRRTDQRRRKTLRQAPMPPLDAAQAAAAGGFSLWPFSKDKDHAQAQIAAQGQNRPE